MPKKYHSLEPRTLYVLEPKADRVDTASRYILALAILLALAAVTGHLLGYVDVYGGLL
jgi:hypothetical protein